MKPRWNLPRLLLTIAIATSVWMLVATLCVMAGSSTSLGWPTTEIFKIRREVVLNSSLIGAALAAAGVAYQAVLRNPLADPYLLGASSGAALAAYLWQLPVAAGWMVGGGSAAQAFGQQGFAFGGALIAVGVVFVLAGGGGRLQPLTLLLVGVIVNSINGSLFLLIDRLHRELPGGQGALTFLVGAIQTNLTKMQETLAIMICAIGVLVLAFISGELNTAMLSDDEAATLGIRVQRLRWIALIAASCMTAAVVAISGPIGFVGLVCPHLARLIVGRDVRILLPASMASGAILLAVADAISRTLASANHLQTSLPVGVLTGLMGRTVFPAAFMAETTGASRAWDGRAMTILQASEVRVRFADATIIDGASLSLEAGEIISLIGPNGCGKSTLIRALLGLIESSGSVRWEGQERACWDRRALARRVAYLPQIPMNEPGQTVREVLQLGRSPYLRGFGLESKRDGDVVEAEFERLDLPDRAMEQLSGGQRQRVFVGRCLVQEPIAMLLDEPDTFLDLRHAVALHRDLRKLAQEKQMAILITSHDLNAAGAFTDRMLLMHEGRIVANGSPDEVMRVDQMSQVFGVQLERIDRPGRTPILVPTRM